MCLGEWMCEIESEQVNVGMCDLCPCELASDHVNDQVSKCAYMCE